MSREYLQFVSLGPVWPVRVWVTIRDLWQHTLPNILASILLATLYSVTRMVSIQLYVETLENSVSLHADIFSSKVFCS